MIHASEQHHEPHRVVVLLRVAELGTAAAAVALTGGITSPLLLPVLALAVFRLLLIRRRKDERPLAVGEHDLGRIEHLGHVNAMLSTLHDLVRTIPTSLSVDEVIHTIRAQLDQLFDADAVVLLITEGGSDVWRPVYAEGVRIPAPLTFSQLPPPVRERGPSQRPVTAVLPPGGGLWSEAQEGAYLWLWSRGQPLGLLALEFELPVGVSSEQADLLERLGNPLSLALDNAVWFRRLRTLGAEEERQRIGAELHDSFAQSLAYIALQLDRTGARYPEDDELRGLRDDVRTTLHDLRETLRDLRVNVTEERSLASILDDLADRFGDRYGVEVSVERSGDGVRPPVVIEQQLLRVVQDLLRLAQRESAATRIAVNYSTAPGRASVTVVDDGLGTPESALGPDGRVILASVRERTDAMGGRIRVQETPQQGRVVEVEVRGLL